jgi:sortase A
MQNRNRILGTTVIIAGLLLALVPVAKYGVSVYYQRQIMSALVDEPLPIPEPMPVEPDTVTVTPDDEPPEGLPAINGILEIPKINMQAVVVQGVTEEHLKQGPGFYPQSKYPETGNVSIAAHRGVYGSWFRNVNKLEPGDEIVLTLGDTLYHYSVREQFVTHSRDWSVVDSTGSAELTLTTCLFTTTTRRLIVKADLTKTEKAPQTQRLKIQ